MATIILWPLYNRVILLEKYRKVRCAKLREGRWAFSS